GGKPAHAEHRLRFKSSVNRSAKRKALVEAQHESQNGGRIKRGKTNRGQFLESELGASRKGQRVDFLFRDKQHDFVPACPQRFGHGDAGEEMPAGSAARNDCVHRGNEGGSTSPRAMLNNAGLPPRLASRSPRRRLFDPTVSAFMKVNGGL